jgi:hypothetical protein
MRYQVVMLIYIPPLYYVFPSRKTGVKFISKCWQATLGTYSLKLRSSMPENACLSLFNRTLNTLPRLACMTWFNHTGYAYYNRVSALMDYFYRNWSTRCIVKNMYESFKHFKNVLAFRRRSILLVVQWYKKWELVGATLTSTIITYINVCIN